MSTNNKRQNRSFNSNLEFISKSHKNRKKGNNSPIRNYLANHSQPSDLKRSSINKLKINSDLNNSDISSNLFNIKKKRLDKRKSLKFIEKDIKNKILDLSILIEKEDNIASGISKEYNNNLNLSTFIKKQIDGEYDCPTSPKNKLINNKKIKGKNVENKIEKFDLNESLSKQSLMQNTNNSISRIYNNQNNQKGIDKFRILFKKKLIYDSFTEEEKENEFERFYISPKSKFILIFDFLIIIFSLFDIIYTPYNLSRIEGFCQQRSNFANFIYFCLDILYIFDLLLGFVRSYYNFQFIIIKYKPRIIRHYIVTQFWFDFFQALPVFTYISFLCRNRYDNHCQAYDLDNKQFFLLLFCFVKQIKLFKIIDLKKNSIMFKIKEDISEKEFVENIINLLITTGICIFCFYSFISIHIFIGKHSYPNWISRNGFQNQSHSLLYLTSFYYLITTMTTVGYGDIVVASFSETIFQIIVLSVGITVYSWIVSNIGNYVKNESYASMRFNKDGTILEEIRISHPNMPFKLYKQILQHLNARKIRQQQCDSNLLINSLPYSLKNSVLLAIYKQTIKNLKIFKNCNNSDFILRLLNNFIPLFSKKNAMLIHEGQLIENIIFVKNGRLSLQAAIDIDEPEESMKHYLDKNFGDISDDLMLLSKYESSSSESSIYQSIDMKKTINVAKTVLESVVNTKTKSALNSEINESRLGKEMGKWDYGGDDFEESNYQFLNIVNIAKNESYGVVYMFLNKPSPLSLRVKSKKVELLLLRKNDSSDISQRYPNIWMKYFKKSYFNILSIKKIAISKIKHFMNNFEKKPNKKKQILKSKTNLNPNTIFKLKQKDADEIQNIIRNTDKIYQINRSKTQRKKIQNIKGSSPINKILNSNNKSYKKKSISYSTNIKNHDSSFLNSNSKNFDLNNEKGESNSNINENNLNIRFSNQKIDGGKSPLNKGSLFRRFSNRNQRYPRKKRINKLKNEIKKLKNSKQYYKKLCHSLTICKTNSHFNSSILSNFKKKNITSMELGEILNKNVNIFHNINPNIINNITIKNNNKFLCKSKNKDSPNNSESFSSEKIERKFDLEQMEIHSEINIFYRAKYINLEKFTSGEFSRNEELRKQSLNFIKVFLEINKKKNKKINKINHKSIQTNKIENPYITNYDFRYILNKINVNRQRKNSVSNTHKSIILKKQNNYITQYLFSIIGDDKSDNSSLTSNKKSYSKGVSKRTFSKIGKKRNNKIKTSYSPNKKYKKGTVNISEKLDNSIDEPKDKKDTIAFLKLPIKTQTINEWGNENESISNQQINEKNLSKSMNSEDNKNENMSNTFCNGINSFDSQKSNNKSKGINLNFQTSNE